MEHLRLAHRSGPSVVRHRGEGAAEERGGGSPTGGGHERQERTLAWSSVLLPSPSRRIIGAAAGDVSTLARVNRVPWTVGRVGAMQQRVSLIALGVADVVAARTMSGSAGAAPRWRTTWDRRRRLTASSRRPGGGRTDRAATGRDVLRRIRECLHRPGRPPLGGRPQPWVRAPRRLQRGPCARHLSQAVS